MAADGGTQSEQTRRRMPPVDSRSGWTTAPPAARAAGDEAYRVFDSLEAALAFLRQQAYGETAPPHNRQAR